MGRQLPLLASADADADAGAARVGCSWFVQSVAWQSNSPG